jgi:hypothetical protein
MRMGCRHSVRESLVHLERAVFDQFGGKQCRAGNGNDLVIISVLDHDGTSIFFKSFVKSVSDKALMQS